MEPKLTNTAGLKTYSRSKCWKVLNPKDIKSEPLTTKEAVKYLLQGSLKRRVCRFCLAATTSLSELDEILEVASSGAIFQVTIRDMVASFYPFQVADDPNFPNKICGKCLDRTINSYLFTQQCERAERALRNCFTDINEKFDKLDPIERVKKRGRQKLNPNHNILHVEHKKVINYAEPIINIVNVGSSLEDNNVAIREINELECPKCWQVFTNVESLLNHEKIHPKSMWYNCRLCGKSFVKLSLYKKHLKQFHVKESRTEVGTNKQHFQCKDCGTVIEELENYLQHIEKHKFKNVLEHLVEKKMDSLCGVCLDKEDGMVELNETLSLHGGYPELSGEMTMATILTATIPEKTNKYEELLVPKEANRVKISKRVNRAAEISKVKQDVTEKAYINTSSGVLTEKSKSCDMFSFSNPIQISNNFDHEMDNVDYNIDQTDNCLNSKKTKCDKSVENTNYVDTGVGFSFSFSDPLKVSDDFCGIKTVSQNLDLTQTNIGMKQKEGPVEVNKVECTSGISKTPILCIICSIFKKAQCKKCIENLSINNGCTNKVNLEVEGTQIKPCKMCWIFTKVGMCEYCQKPTDDKTEKDKDILDHTEEVAKNQQRNIELEKDKNIEPENEKSIKPEREKNILSERENSIESEKKRNIESGRERNILEDVPSRKRKMEPENIVPNQKRKINSGLAQTTKWQCEICLTNNDNRESCFCCGEKKTKEDSVKFSFTFSKYNATKYKDIIKPEQVNNNNYITNDHEEVNKEVQSENIQQEDKTADSGDNLIPNMCVPIKTDVPSDMECIDSTLDVNLDGDNLFKFSGKTETLVGNFNTFVDTVEKVSPATQMMNVDEETCNTTFDPPTMQSFSPILATPPPQFGLNFSIGSQADDKKYRKILKSTRHKRDRYLKK